MRWQEQTGLPSQPHLSHSSPTMPGQNCGQFPKRKLSLETFAGTQLRCAWTACCRTTHVPQLAAPMLVGYPSSFHPPELGACKGYPALLPHCRQMDGEGTAPVAPLGMAPPRTQPQAWQHGAVEVGWAGIHLPVLRHLLQHCRNLLRAPLPGSPDHADTPMEAAHDSNQTTCRVPWRKQ